MEYTQFFKKWFSTATPLAGVKASGTLTISGVVSDTQTVTIGTNVYEFDIDNTYTAGRIQVNVADLRNQATSTLTFTDIPIVTETVTVGSGDDAEVYEFVAAAGDVADPANIPVVLGATLTADNAVTKLAEAISANSALVDATFSTEDDTVIIVADVRGTAGNSIATTETCTNASWTGETLAGGLDTITASNAVTALVASITANDAYVTAADGANDTVVVTYKWVGTDGNAIATTETMANGAFGHAHLEGGVYATPVNCSAFIIIEGVWYIADAPVTKYTLGGWKSATPA
ncbi:MAG: hypothetical protein PHT02_00170 [Tissierellia bacterium]|nr:hypothetical protein [Tissierellia bacterium]